MKCECSIGTCHIQDCASEATTNVVVTWGDDERKYAPTRRLCDECVQSYIEDWEGGTNARLAEEAR